MKSLVALLLFLPLLVQAEMNFISLKHRSAETLVPLLQPVLDEGVRISGKGFTLIVNGTPGELKEVRALVEQVDTPLQSLIISVFQGGDSKRSALHGDVSGSLEQPTVRLYGTRNQGSDGLTQQLRVIEGQWAVISTGESVPLVKQTTTHTRHGRSLQQSIEYKDVQSGFEVRPQINGEIVTLEVRPFQARRSTTQAGTIEQQEINTTVRGRLGEWISLGGVNEHQHASGMGTVYAGDKARSTQRNVQIRVEILPN